MYIRVKELNGVFYRRYRSAVFIVRRDNEMRCCTDTEPLGDGRAFINWGITLPKSIS